MLPDCATQNLAEYRDLQFLLAGRAYLYDLFHKLFGGNPTEDLLKVLFSPETFAALDSFAQAAETLAKLSSYLRAVEVKACKPFWQADVRAEYARMFVGPAKLPVPVWESFYAGSEPALFGEVTLSVRLAYACEGFACARAPKVADDHIAIMADFQSQLAQRVFRALMAGEREAARGGLLCAARFNRDHLATWMPELSQGVRRVPTMYLYPQLIQAFASFTAVDAVLTGEAYEWVGAQNDPIQGSDVLEPRCTALVHGFQNVHAIRLFGLENNELALIGEKGSL